MSSRLMRHLVWTPVGEHPTGTRSMLALVAAGGRSEDLNIDASLGPRDAAIYLLHIGAEVEHLLMVQYSASS